MVKIQNVDFGIIIPVFNEERNLKNQILRLKKENLLHKAYFINDGSTDNSLEILKTYNCNYITYKQNMGVGYAIQSGLKYLLQKKVSIVVIMAGDDQDNPSQIVDLVYPILYENYDFVQGSRYIHQKKHAGVIWKKNTTKLYSILFSLVAHKKITDASNGFRAFRISIIKKFNILDRNLSNYDFEPLLMMKAIHNQYRFKEISVNKYYNIHTGYTKMRSLKSFYFILKPIFILLFSKEYIHR